MNIRTIIIGVAVLLGVGYVFYDYNSPDSKNARELKEIEQLEPDIKPADCFPKGINGKLFAEVIEHDRRKPVDLESDQTRRSAIEHDCIRGPGAGYEPTQITRLVKALGPAGIPTYTEVFEKCPVVKDEYPVYSCIAMDALTAEGSKESLAVIEKELSNHDKTRKNVYLGALYRLMNTPGWKTNAQLAALIGQQGDDWKAKELIIEHIRNHKDLSAKADLEKAYASETDQQEKGMIKGALLELANPGKCVMFDEGRAEKGICYYTCLDQNKRFNTPKPAEGCALVRDLPPEAQQPPVAAAATAPTTAVPAAAKK